MFCEGGLKRRRTTLSSLVYLADCDPVFQSQELTLDSFPQHVGLPSICADSIEARAGSLPHEEGQLLFEFFRLCHAPRPSYFVTSSRMLVSRHWHRSTICIGDGMCRLSLCRSGFTQSEAKVLP